MINSLVKKTSGSLNIEEKKVMREVLDDLQKTYVDKTRDKAKASSGGNPPRPLVPIPPGSVKPKTDVKEWIRVVQEEIAKKKQNPEPPKN